MKRKYLLIITLFINSALFANNYIELITKDIIAFVNSSLTLSKSSKEKELLELNKLYCDSLVDRMHLRREIYKIEFYIGLHSILLDKFKSDEAQNSISKKLLEFFKNEDFLKYMSLKDANEPQNFEKFLKALIQKVTIFNRDFIKLFEQDEYHPRVILNLIFLLDYITLNDNPILGYATRSKL